MIYILLSILISSGLFIIFKYFGIYKIDILKAIVVNYMVAFSLGVIDSEIQPSPSEILQKDWIIGAVFLGFMFVSVFFVMAKTAQVNGVSVASVAGKMSVVIPVFFGIFLYNESLSILKFLGIIIALIAVYLASVKKGIEITHQKSLKYPILLFFGSGAIDTVLKYVEINFVAKDEVAIFSGVLFGIAALIGVLILMIKTMQNRESFGTKNIVAGIILGVPNYFSIIFLIKALQVEGLESSTLFTINNVGIVVFSTFIGLILFKERLSHRNIVGVLFAILGIILVTFA